MISLGRSDGNLISLSSLSSACHSSGQVWPLRPLSPPTTGLGRPGSSHSSCCGYRSLSLTSTSTGQRRHEICLDEDGVVAIKFEKVGIPTNVKSVISCGVYVSVCLMCKGGGIGTTGSGKPRLCRRKCSPKYHARQTGPSRKTRNREVSRAPINRSLTTSGSTAQGCQVICK